MATDGQAAADGAVELVPLGTAHLAAAERLHAAQLVRLLRFRPYLIAASAAQLLRSSSIYLMRCVRKFGIKRLNFTGKR